MGELWLSCEISSRIAKPFSLLVLDASPVFHSFSLVNSCVDLQRNISVCCEFPSRTIAFSKRKVRICESVNLLQATELSCSHSHSSGEYVRAPLSFICHILNVSEDEGFRAVSLSALDAVGSLRNMQLTEGDCVSFRSLTFTVRVPGAGNVRSDDRVCIQKFPPKATDVTGFAISLYQGDSTPLLNKLGVNKGQDTLTPTENPSFSFSECSLHSPIFKLQTSCCRLSYKKLTPAFTLSMLHSRRACFDFFPRFIHASYAKEEVRPSNSRSFRINANGPKFKRNWWKRFLFEEIDSDLDFDTGNDFNSSDEDDDSGRTGNLTDSRDAQDSVVDIEDEVDRMLEDDDSFRSWKQRTDAMSELRESQESGRDPGNKDWEDWLGDSWEDFSGYAGIGDGGWYAPQSEWERNGLPRDPPKMPERGMNRTLKEFLLRIFERQEEVEADLEFEERLFRFTSQSTAKFVAVLVLLPWLVDSITHDYIIVPFLNRYVETVPLAAQVLDLRESQKLKMVETLKLERQRVRFEAVIGKTPPLSDQEFAQHIRHKALELREELRLENRKAFGNLWSDLLAGVTVLLLLIFNPEKVAIVRLTGRRLFTNISDTGKAFIIILLSDIFLGYHSESGWETVIEMFLEHYGFEVDQASIYLFVAIVPVTIDACFKLWVFRYLSRLSPSAAATFREMKRH
eukprot:c28264_g1_i1 orf=214-2259(+)